MTVAPGSTSPSEMHYWIVDRAVDNGSNSNENDGKLFELSAPGGGGGGPTNTPPVVSAGPNLTITLPASATLQGSVTDDGLPDPPGVTTSLWTQVSGPGTVTFANAASPSTTATFSTDGDYVLRLTADDSAAQRSDDVTVHVLPEGGGGGGSGVIEVQVSASSDDAEETSGGSVRPASSDLELVQDDTQQTVGMRFTGVAVPAGATITSAYVQFRSDEVGSVATSLTITGEDSDDAPTFVKVNGNISSRPDTGQSVDWSPAAWTAIGQAGLDQRTPNLALVIQEIVDRTGWSSGNAIVLVVTGTGKRTADASDSGWGPILHVEFQT
jgi:hypothetical protein